MKTLLRYDGKWDWYPKDRDPRMWTVMSHFQDSNNQDRWHGSFDLKQLHELGILPGAHS